MVVLPDSVKREIQNSKLQRELRRRGVGQHTIERALNDRVRLSSARKILAAIAAYKHDLNKKRTKLIARPKTEGENHAVQK